MSIFSSFGLNFIDLGDRLVNAIRPTQASIYDNYNDTILHRYYLSAPIQKIASTPRHSQ
jgi:hypothetical protein